MTSESQLILNKISALRQRMEQARSQAKDAGTAAAAQLEEREPPGLARLWELERQAAVGTSQRLMLDAAVKAPEAPAERPLPVQLTARARRVLEKGRELLQNLREYHAEPLALEPGGILNALYRETASLAEAGLRLATSLPDSPTKQLQLCDSIESLLNAAAQRLASLGLSIRRLREEQSRIDLIADFLARLDAGSPPELAAIRELAVKLLAEASDSFPLRIVQMPAPAADQHWAARLVAGHCFTVAQVMARLVRQEPELRGQAAEAVMAALLHDAGMMRVPAALLAKAGPLDDASKRTLEGHCQAGGFLMSHFFPSHRWLIEAASQHHERSDGTGYPDGLSESQLSPFARLLAVCDAYAAACQDRPHRRARETRTALTDILLLAEQGRFDRRFAERLLQLSFYPPGSVVELADGALAGVVAAPLGRHDLQAPARPVVALLTDAQGTFLPSPCYLDLSQGDSHSIVRSLDPEERRRTLGPRYPEWAL